MNTRRLSHSREIRVRVTLFRLMRHRPRILIATQVLGEWFLEQAEQYPDVSFIPLRTRSRVRRNRKRCNGPSQG